MHTLAQGELGSLTPLVLEGDPGLVRPAIHFLLGEALSAERARFLASDRGVHGDRASGYRGAVVRTKLGDVAVRVPTLRRGALPLLALENYAAHEDALLHRLVRGLLMGFSREDAATLFRILVQEAPTSTEVGTLWQGLVRFSAAWRAGRLGASPCLLVDAVALDSQKRDANGALTHVLVTIAIQRDGPPRVVGCDAVSELSLKAWNDHFRALEARGLSGVRLVVADDHAGLPETLSFRFSEGAWHASPFRIGTHALVSTVGASLEARLQAPALSAGTHAHGTPPESAFDVE